MSTSSILMRILTQNSENVPNLRNFYIFSVAHAAKVNAIPLHKLLKALPLLRWIAAGMQDANADRPRTYSIVVQCDSKSKGPGEGIRGARQGPVKLPIRS